MLEKQLYEIKKKTIWCRKNFSLMVTWCLFKICWQRFSFVMCKWNTLDIIMIILHDYDLSIFRETKINKILFAGTTAASFFFKWNEHFRIWLVNFRYSTSRSGNAKVFNTICYRIIRHGPFSCFFFSSKITFSN